LWCADGDEKKELRKAGLWHDDYMTSAAGRGEVDMIKGETNGTVIYRSKSPRPAALLV
jgi:hypothetical protein